MVSQGCLLAACAQVDVSAKAPVLREYIRAITYACLIPLIHPAGRILPHTQLQAIPPQPPHIIPKRARPTPQSYPAPTTAAI
jgi:hypothetical protein